MCLFGDFRYRAQILFKKIFGLLKIPDTTSLQLKISNTHTINMNENRSIERKRFCISLFVSLIFIVALWCIKIFEIVEGISLYRLGVFPRQISGLPGIIFSPLIHSDFNHLISNSLSLLFLLIGLLYFYRDLSYKVILFIWISSGLMVWVGARDSYHIGASGLIYGLASFLFFSGVVRHDQRLMAISLIVVFFYGGLIWGILPVYPAISWEYHLFGGISGLIAAILFRNQGPPRKVWSWEQEEDENTPENL